ncbi:MAG TPA: GatB/YqeY domain-containing protein, partial [Dehalococcoidia bacterium]
GKEVEDSDSLAVLAKEAKQRRESIEEFGKARRQDLVDKEQAELDILLAYMPQQLSRAEIEAAVRRIIAATGASGPRDKGKVMPPLMAETRGRADGALVNAVVTELLAEGA